MCVIFVKGLVTWLRREDEQTFPTPARSEARASMKALAKLSRAATSGLADLRDDRRGLVARLMQQLSESLDRVHTCATHAPMSALSKSVRLSTARGPTPGSETSLLQPSLCAISDSEIVWKTEFARNSHLRARETLGLCTCIEKLRERLRMG